MYEGRTVVESEDETLIQNNTLYIKENALACKKVVDGAKKATRYVFSGTTLDILALIQETFTVDNNLSPKARKNNILTLQKAIQCTPIDGKITEGTMSSISLWIASLEKSTSLPGIASEQQAMQEHTTRNRGRNDVSVPTNG